MTLSVIIVNWNTKDLLRQCLNSIYQHTSGLDFEVIVVDNGSSDGSVEMIRNDFPQVVLIANQQNLGFAKANNLGFEKSRSTLPEYVLFLNSDTLIKENSFLKMVEIFKNNKTIGALSAKLIYPNGQFQEEFYRKFPSLSQTFWLYLLPLNRLTFKINFLKQRYLTSINGEKSGQINDLNLPGACLMIPSEILKKVGLWDENFWIWLEDVDLSWRIKMAGYKLCYLAETEIIHFGGASFAQWDSFKMIYNFRLSYLKYFQKHKGKFQAFLVKWLFIFNALFLILPLLFIGFFAKKYQSKAGVFWQFVKEFY